MLVIGKRNETICTVLLAALFIGLCAFLWELWPAIIFIVLMAREPPGWGCDEGPVADRDSANGQGDVVEEYIKICTGFGTIVDESIILQLKGEEKMTTLVEHDRLHYEYPKFHWLNDDILSIGLGEVAWISRKVEKVGSIHITYSYTMTRDCLDSS